MTKENTDHMLTGSLVEDAGGSGLSEDTDLLVRIGHKIENLTKEEAYEQAARVREAKDSCVFFLGGVLSVIRVNGWYKEEGYSGFGRFVEERFGIARTTAHYYCQIYECLVESGVEWRDVRHLGWTKIRYIAPVLTEENAAQWIEIAEGMSAVELQEYVRKQKKEAAQAALVSSLPLQEESPSTQVDTVKRGPVERTPLPRGQAPLVSPTVAEKIQTSRSFRLYPDQLEVVDAALEHAKGESDTSYDSVALERVCLAYLRSGESEGKNLSIEALLRAIGWEGILRRMECFWPELDILVTVTDEYTAPQAGASGAVDRLSLERTGA